MHTRRTSKIAALVGGALLAVLLAVAPATAHVTVQPPEAEQGSFAKLTFRVPNERPDAATVGLRVQLPQDHPFTSVSVKPKQGWTVEVTERTLDTPLDNHGTPVSEVASEITWSGGQIQAGEFDEFEISVGRMPTDVDTLYFPAIQVYENGEEVSWIEIPSTPDEEPENPAPALTLTPASGDGHGGATAVSASGDGSSSGDESAAADSDHDDSSSDGLAIAALVVGGIAIVLSVIALAAGRRGARA
jgi:uncharacterized protein YcnI